MNARTDALAVDPRDRFTRVAPWARGKGLTSRHVFALRRRHPDLWPPCLRSNTTLFARVGDLEDFLSAVMQRESAQPDRFGEYAQKANASKRAKAAPPPVKAAGTRRARGP